MTDPEQKPASEGADAQVGLEHDDLLPEEALGSIGGGAQVDFNPRNLNRF